LTAAPDYVTRGIDEPYNIQREWVQILFFSREESRPHVPVYCSAGKAKFWLDPELELARNYRLSKVQLKEVEKIIERRYDELKAAWNSFFGS
jgi:hypothetical protein